MRALLRRSKSTANLSPLELKPWVRLAEHADRLPELVIARSRPERSFHLGRWHDSQRFAGGILVRSNPFIEKVEGKCRSRYSTPIDRGRHIPMPTQYSK